MVLSNTRRDVSIASFNISSGISFLSFTFAPHIFAHCTKSPILRMKNRSKETIICGTIRTIIKKIKKMCVSRTAKKSLVKQEKNRSSSFDLVIIFSYCPGVHAKTKDKEPPKQPHWKVPLHVVLEQGEFWRITTRNRRNSGYTKNKHLSLFEIFVICNELVYK